MGKFTTNIEIEASPEKVFAYGISDTMNDVWKEWYEAKWTSEGPVRVGSMAHFIGNPNFLKGEWDSEVTEFVKNEKMVLRNMGATKGTSSMGFEPTTKGTMVTFYMDYELPYSVLGKLIDKLKVNKDMKKMGKKLLENLKKAIEVK